MPRRTAIVPHPSTPRVQHGRNRMNILEFTRMSRPHRTVIVPRPNTNVAQLSLVDRDGYRNFTRSGHLYKLKKTRISVILIVPTNNKIVFKRYRLGVRNVNGVEYKYDRVRKKIFIGTGGHIPL